MYPYSYPPEQLPQQIWLRDEDVAQQPPYSYPHHHHHHHHHADWAPPPTADYFPPIPAYPRQPEVYYQLQPLSPQRSNAAQHQYVPHPVAYANNTAPRQEHGEEPSEEYADGAPKPPKPPRSSSSTASHTTFKTNGVQYRPPRRHTSSDDTATQQQARLRVTPRSPKSPSPYALVPVSPRSHAPSSPASSSARSLSSPWGYLFHAPQPNAPPTATPKLTRLLISIATYLSTSPPFTESVIPRSKLTTYYTTFSPHSSALDHRGAYLHTATPRGLQRLWTFLGCRFYLVPTTITTDPAPSSSDSPEFVPALTHAGFVRWSTIQMLLCPDLEVAVVDAVLRAVELRDPETPSAAWPRGLEREAVGGVDAVAGERWGRWWGVLLQPDEEGKEEEGARAEAEAEAQAEVERLRARVRELEGSDVMEIARRERRRGDEARAQERLEVEMERLAMEIMASQDQGEQGEEDEEEEMWLGQRRKGDADDG